MPRTIVCGVDQSDAAEAVANTARWFSNRLKARLVLVHVAEEPAGKVDGSPVASWPGDSP
jgi:nucleotide-binding universal stress UspA family protein